MGTFKFERNGSTMWSLLGTVWADAAPNVPRWLAASLYGPQDAVFNPKIVPTARSGYSDASLSGMTALSGSINASTSTAVVGGLSVSSGMFSKSTAVLGELEQRVE